MSRESRARFRHEDVSGVPMGWHVLTVRHGTHRVRFAFPPGRRRKGSGRLISVLHPIAENPCALRSTNPAELLVLSANPPRKRNGVGYRVVVLARVDTSEPTFASQTFETKAEARKVAAQVDRKKWYPPHIQKVRVGQERGNPGAELVVMAANPPAAAEIYEGFSGRPSEWVTTDSEPHMPKGDYAQLGKLLNLYVKPIGGGYVRDLKFKADKPMVVCDRTARQIYFVGGDQDISDALKQFGARDRGNQVFELGRGERIDYQARKDHVAEPDEDKWKHHFGEENGAKPAVLFDARHKRLLLEGGDYRIDGAWIRN